MRKILLSCILLFLAWNVNAQNGWPSPEVEQMYRHAQENVAMGNYKDAIVTFRQAIVLAPGKFVLYKGLGKALYLSGNYSDAEDVLRPYIERPEADEEFYDLLAASETAQNNTKQAKVILNKGLERFPSSGLLYHGEGHVYELEKKPGRALGAWEDGIHKDPTYDRNYYEAARVYMSKEDALWGLLYGETYLNIARDTTGTAVLKKMLFVAYKTMFDNITADITNNRKAKEPNSFTDAVRQIYLTLTPVVSDGITTENLTMVRTRFLMDWFATYAKKYPYSLFSYQDYLVRNGLFDIYNEWLFGRVESITEYNAWNQFHPGEMDIWLEKKQEHALRPVSTDAYGTMTK